MLQSHASKGTSSLKGIFTLSLTALLLLYGCARSSDNNATESFQPGHKGSKANALSTAGSPEAPERKNYKEGTDFRGRAPSDAEQPSAAQMLARLLSRAAPAGAMATLGDEQIKDALAGLGHETLEAIRLRLESGEALSTLGDENSWEGSEEQLLLQVLLSLEMPEIQAIALDWMAASPSPRAVAELGRYLGQHSPGVHDGAIRAAAELSLLSAASLSEVPGELFQLLGEYGDAGTVNLLADMPWHRDAYASVALALIPDGSGMGFLVRDARLFGQGQSTTHARLAIELLAQQAHLSPDAAEALLELAERGLIPTELWPDVLAAAAGEQYLSLVRPVSCLQSVHTIFRPEGDQSLYRVKRIGPPPEEAWVEEFRLAVLEALLQFAPKLTATKRVGSGH